MLREAFLRGRPQRRLQGVPELTHLLALSALWHALIVVATIRVVAWGRDDALWEHRWWVVGYVVALLVVAPAVCGYLTGAVLEARAASRDSSQGFWHALGKLLVPKSQPPQAWDVAWTRASRGYRYVIVIRTDGSRVGGLFSTGSWASLSPSTRDVFLEEAWDVEGEAFVRRRPGTGMWLSAESVEEVLFLLAEGGNAEEQNDAEVE